MTVAVKSFLVDFAAPELIEAIENALGHAETAGQTASLAHVADALLQDSTVTQYVDPAICVKARGFLAELISEQPKSTDGRAGTFGFHLELLTDPAVALSRDCGAQKVSPLLFLASILTADVGTDAASIRCQESLRRAGLSLETLMPVRPAAQTQRMDFTYKSLGFGEDLTAKARAGHWSACPLIGQERELQQLVVSIASAGNSVVIVGEPGVGKSALLHGLSYHIAHKTRPLIPPEMDTYTVVSIAPSNLLAGTGGRGELETRLDEMLTFFRKNPNVIPFFDEVHTLLDTDDASSRSIATALKPPMANGAFRCIGATTDREYARFIANDEAMNSRFDKILLSEPDQDTAVQIIQGAMKSLLSDQARRHEVTVPEESIRAAVKVTAVYQRNDRLPRKAIKLLQRVIANTVYSLQIGEEAKPEISKADTINTFSALSGIPVTDLDTDRPGYYRSLAETIDGSVRGQGDAVRAVTNWLAIHASGWVDSRRPRGRFLFLGPPGVGKTHLALALAAEVLKDRGSLIVKNMAEYKGEGAKTRFMGADPGYVGYGQVPTIYSRVMMRPYSVVVLDEFEKAHGELAHPLISVLDGDAEDSQGRRVDFSQCIFIMTSNSLDRWVTPDMPEDEIRRVLVQVGGIWQAPLVDRIDRIIFFQPLDREVLAQILDGLVEARRKSAQRPLPPEIDTPEVREALLDAATRDETTSARGLERALLQWLISCAND